MISGGVFSIPISNNNIMSEIKKSVRIHFYLFDGIDGGGEAKKFTLGVKL